MTTTGAMRPLLALAASLGAVALSLCAAALPRAATAAPAKASAAGTAVTLPKVSLNMRFTPNLLGQSTTIHYAFAVSRPEPLRSVALRLPPGMGFAATSLGIESCRPELLLGAGPRGCPGNSLIGAGIALAEVPARTNVEEKVKVTALMGPPNGQEMTVLFFLDGKWPVQREVVMSARLLNIAGPRGATLITEAPPLPVWPDGPDVGLVRFRSTIGPQGLTYHRRIGHRRVSFTPRGVSVPDRCPAGGFPVWATFSWWGLPGRTVARSHVPCPRGRHSSRHRAPRRPRRLPR